MPLGSTERILKDPMVILLLVASVIYFVSGQTNAFLWCRRLSWFRISMYQDS
jgi:hypothetical protein